MSAPTALLLHGQWMGGWTFGWLGHVLRGAGLGTRAVDYPSTEDSPEALVERLARAVAETPGDVHLVGHSMGGVVVLRYLQTGADARVRRALLLGTPALGCRAALEFEQQPLGRFMLGRSTAFWRAPFPDRVDTPVEVGAIAGDSPFGLGAVLIRLPEPSDGVVTVAETRIGGLHDHIVLPVSHTGMLLSGDVGRQAVAFLGRGRFEK